MSEEKTDNVINVAIVGGGPECKAMMDMFLAPEFGSLGVRIIAVAGDDKRSRSYRYARKKVFTLPRTFRVFAV